MLRQQQLPHEALKESLVAQDIFYGAQGNSIVVEMSNHITLSKDAPLKFEKYRLLVDFMSTLTRD